MKYESTRNLSGGLAKALGEGTACGVFQDVRQVARKFIHFLDCRALEASSGAATPDKATEVQRAEVKGLGLFAGI